MSIAKFSGLLIRQIFKNCLKPCARNFAIEKPWAEKCANPRGLIASQLTKEDFKKWNLKTPKYCNVQPGRFYSKIWIPELREKYESNAAVIDYQRTHQDILSKNRKLMMHVENESRSILRELERELEMSNIDYCLGLIRTSYDMGIKLRELFSLDEYCGSLKCKELQVTNYQTKRAFNRLHYDAVPTVKKIRKMLEELQQEVKRNTCHAENVVTSCRSCTSAHNVQECLHSSHEEAAKILKESADNAKLKLRIVRELKGDILRRHKQATDEVIVTYRAKMIGLTRQLDRCIRVIKSNDE